jgi:hypothetical protein
MPRVEQVRERHTTGTELLQNEAPPAEDARGPVFPPTSPDQPIQPAMDENPRSARHPVNVGLTVQLKSLIPSLNVTSTDRDNG